MGFGGSDVGFWMLIGLCVCPVLAGHGAYSASYWSMSCILLKIFRAVEASRVVEHVCVDFCMLLLSTLLGGDQSTCFTLMNSNFDHVEIEDRFATRWIDGGNF